MKPSTMLNTYGNKFWESISNEWKFQILMNFERWKNPSITAEDAFDKAKIREMFTWSEFDPVTQDQFTKFIDKCYKIRNLKDEKK